MSMHRLLQFTLDLFDVAPVYELPKKPRAKRVVKPTVQPHAQPAFQPTNLPVIQADRPAPAAPAAVVFSRHPLASQQSRLNGHWVDYELQRSRRRTMTFSVSTDGLSVRAPFGMPQHSIEAAVQEKARWIVTKLAGMQQRVVKMEALRITWQDGVRLDYMGQQLQVNLGGVGRQAQLLAPVSAPGAEGDVWQLTLPLPATATVAQMRNTTQAWLKQQALQHYTARMHHFAGRLGVKWQKLALSGAATRWGSAKADGSIRLHWRLIQFTPAMIDYVVAHELSHLRELNHSPRFWATLASVLPDYEVPQRQLKAITLPPWE